MKKIFSIVLSLLFVCTVAVATQNPGSTASTSDVAKTRKTIFRANKDQIKQAQGILKQRGFYMGEPTGKLDAETRVGLKKFQAAESLKATGSLNRVTLEKMGVALTDRQKTM